MSGVLLLFIIYYLGFVFLGDVRERNRRFIRYTNASTPPQVSETDIVYKGTELPLGIEEITNILSKHCKFYSHLNDGLKQKFLKRVQKFMRKKMFIIKDDEGFKEMPVLISATAIQLTFGLKHYLLDFYKYIRIYPKEYIADHSLKVLAGNVHNNTITVAWNYFLKGNDNCTDGSNLGLHEMSHALYFQKMVIDGDFTPDFSKKYNSLLAECREAAQLEIEAHKNIYSEYADTDLQEFWAESVEIFFEKPNNLKENYPSVYEAIKILLNQDPLNTVNPILFINSSLSQRILRFLKGKSRP